MNVSRTNPLDAFSFQTIGAHPFHWFRSRDLFWGNHGQHYQSQSVSCKFLSTGLDLWPVRKKAIHSKMQIKYAAELDDP